MKKKGVLALSLLAILGISLVAGGSLAWFSDTDEVANTFTVGSVEIVQNEKDEQGNDFVQDQQLIPVGSNDTPDDDENYIHKVVTVSNKGRNPAYVQTFIAVPKALDNGLLKLDLRLSAGAWEETAPSPVGTMVYDPDENAATDNSLEMNIYCYRYATELAVGGTTTTLLNGVYIDQTTDLEVYRNDADQITKAYFLWNGAEITEYDVAKIEKLPVIVATQAVQSQGFTSASEALGAAFPNHPWHVAP